MTMTKRLDVTLSNAGASNRATASSPPDAVRVLIKMLTEIGVLHDGDIIRVETHPDDRGA
jgi:hypothetical protein